MFVLGNDMSRPAPYMELPHQIYELYPIVNFPFEPDSEHSNRVTAEELEMLDLSPDEILQLQGNRNPMFLPFSEYNMHNMAIHDDDDDDEDYEGEFDMFDDDEDYDDDGDNDDDDEELDMTTLTAEVLSSNHYNQRDPRYFSPIDETSTESLSIDSLGTNSETTTSSGNDVHNNTEINTTQSESVEGNEDVTECMNSDDSEIAWLDNSADEMNCHHYGDCSCSSAASTSRTSDNTTTTDSFSNDSGHSRQFSQNISYLTDSNSCSSGSDSSSDTSSSL